MPVVDTELTQIAANFERRDEARWNAHQREHDLIQRNLDIQLKTISTSMEKIEHILVAQDAAYVRKEAFDKLDKRLAHMETVVEDIKLSVTTSTANNVATKAAIASFGLSIGLLLDIAWKAVGN